MRVPLPLEQPLAESSRCSAARSGGRAAGPRDRGAFPCSGTRRGRRLQARGVLQRRHRRESAGRARSASWRGKLSQCVCRSPQQERSGRFGTLAGAGGASIGLPPGRGSGSEARSSARTSSTRTSPPARARTHAGLMDLEVRSRSRPTAMTSTFEPPARLSRERAAGRGDCLEWKPRSLRESRRPRGKIHVIPCGVDTGDSRRRLMSRTVGPGGGSS